METGTSADVAVVAPSPMLTVTVEADGDIHVHAGGQGFWVARQAARLGARVTLCAALGGETGRVMRPLIEAEAITIAEPAAEAKNGAYIHDRRTGSREVVAQVPGANLSRHGVDDLYGAAFAASMEAAVTVLTGTDPPGLVPSGFYGRIGRDLKSNGRTVIADLTGAELDAGVAGGLSLIKVSSADLATEGRASGDDDSIIGWIRGVSAAGAPNVIVTRGPAPVLALLDGHLITAAAPQTTPHDERGAGDSMLAAIAAALGAGRSLVDALRHGVAAGAMNVTRSGLGSGRAEHIDVIADQVAISPVPAGSGQAGTASITPGDAVEAIQRGVRAADEDTGRQ